MDRGKERKDLEKKGHAIGWAEILLRGLAVLLTLIAAILLAVDKQTEIIPVQISADLPTFNVPVTAKSSYVSAFVYFVVANSIACGLGALTLAIALANKGGGRAFSASRLMIILVDLLMVALLFSGIGAAGAVGLIGFKGNSHLRWNKVCHIYGTFCHKVMASLGVSILGGIAFLILLFLTLLKLSKN
ncbi:CASP-like protein 1E2 [Amaranthus tricolor]|uniref:CASP-like protein 1E2 n=1 Tax=Amaranthus tricolor TaxID=29722 RepID=UPI00258C9872|nr:CASP-like protein 1E2 [Amaranthus tricolor]